MKYFALCVIFEKAAKFEIAVCCKLLVALYGLLATSGLPNGEKGRLGFDACYVCLRGFRPCTEFINHFSMCSTQLSMYFIMPINVKMLTIGKTFISISVKLKLAFSAFETS